jgi:hypothetical protein
MRLSDCERLLISRSGAAIWEHPEHILCRKYRTRPFRKVDSGSQDIGTNLCSHQGKRCIHLN